MDRIHKYHLYMVLHHGYSNSIIQPVLTPRLSDNDTLVFHIDAKHTP